MNLSFSTSFSHQQAFMVAESLKSAGKLAEAEATLRRIIAAAPNFHPAYHSLGLIAYEVGKLPLAMELIVRAISLNPETAHYHRDLGVLSRQLGQLDEAIAAGRRSIALAPNDLYAHYNLGLALADQRRWAEAVLHYRRALEINPNHGLSWNNLGAILEKMGDIAAAEAAYARAVALDPKQAEAQNNLGSILSEQGKLEGASRCFEAAIRTRPDFIEPHYNLSSLKTYREDDPHLTHLEAGVGKAEALPLDTRMRFWFALGKAREDVGRYEGAFAAYAEGNRLKHAQVPVDETHADKQLKKIMAIFDREFFDTRPYRDGTAKAPIFIVGMPRSGTTLLEQILSSHPSVHGAGELMDLNHVINQAPGASDGNFPDFVSALTAADFRSLGEAYAGRLWARAPEAEWITDKMPANFFFIGMIHLMLLNAKIIHAMRDPMDSCLSCYSRLFNEAMDFTYDLGTLGRYYVRYMKLMQHWHSVLPAGTILDLRYEELVSDLEPQARRILDYVGIPWNDRCLAFHENKRHVKTASMAQVRKPIYQSSVARWKRFGGNLAPLLEIVAPYR